MAEANLCGTIKAIDNDNATFTIAVQDPTQSVGLEVSTEGFSAEKINNQIKVGDFVRINASMIWEENRYLLALPKCLPIEHVLNPVPTR